MTVEQHVYNIFLFLGSTPVQHWIMFFTTYLLCGSIYSLYEHYIGVRNLVRNYNYSIEQAYASLSIQDRHLYTEYAGCPIPTFNASKIDNAWLEAFYAGVKKLYVDSTSNAHRNRRDAWGAVSAVYKLTDRYSKEVNEYSVGWSCIMFWPFILPYRMLKEPAKYIYELMINMYNNIKAYAVNRLAKDIG
jgi:hypothetical protein